MNSEPECLAVTGMGMVTPVGDDAMGSALAIQAGISRLAVLDEFPPVAYWDAAAVELEATGAVVRAKTSGLLGVNRLASLAAPALQEACAQARVNLNEAAITLLQAVPSKQPERDDRIEQLLPRRLERQCGIARGKLSCRLIEQGHAGTIFALQEAAKLLAENRTGQVVVGAVDSLVEPPMLQWFEQRERLKAGSRVDGFCPGEAAAYLVLETPEHAAQKRKTVLGFLSGFAVASEPNTIWSKRPCVGKGLADAIRQTISPLKGNASRVRLVIGDLNGERYRAVEWSYAEMRAFAGFDVERQVWHHADCIGDTGCASGAVSLVYAIAALRAALADSDVALVFSSADDGQRGTVLVSTQLPVSLVA